MCRRRVTSVSRNKQTLPNGFTLLEMMVALAIFSLAALAMVRLQGYSVRSAAVLGDSSTAWQVARNIAVEQLSDPAPPVIGEERGEEVNGGQTWTWAVDTQQTDDARLLRMDIVVAGTGLAARRTARLTIARPVEQ